MPDLQVGCPLGHGPILSPKSETEPSPEKTPFCRHPGVNKRSLAKNTTLANVTAIAQNISVAMGLSSAAPTEVKSSKCAGQISPTHAVNPEHAGRSGTLRAPWDSSLLS